MDEEADGVAGVISPGHPLMSTSYGFHCLTCGVNSEDRVGRLFIVENVLKFRVMAAVLESRSQWLEVRIIGGGGDDSLRFIQDHFRHRMAPISEYGEIGVEVAPIAIEI